MHSSACTSLKTQGCDVAGSTPIKHLANIRYTIWSALHHNIFPALTACASPNFFLPGDSASDINNASSRCSR